jgi:hypothetical protein
MSTKTTLAIAACFDAKRYRTGVERRLTVQPEAIVS